MNQKEKKFQRKVEDFVCENCGHKIKGSGFTNHCPSCLYSKHVDINPGDRASDCGGLMEPIALEGAIDKEKILFRCQKCGHLKRNKLQKGDNKQKLLKTVLGK
ncbi:RNHCP domain-containing protein [Patescibacteria group bacterium]|nr:RNHCP domain-containing protein [Patescibacteria group bacterium]MBU1673033.1 RNHCP domain-containing protein [Patescibacteria group bacterium]MBU1963593.1 RNHCP domain-containing protein [Patescibacteria group bacterium]